MENMDFSVWSTEALAALHRRVSDELDARGYWDELRERNRAQIQARRKLQAETLAKYGPRPSEESAFDYHRRTGCTPEEALSTI